MAYGVKWRLEFTDELGRDKRADILKKDYTGSIITVTGAGFSPLFTSIQNQGDPKYETVRGTEIELRVYAELTEGTLDFSEDTLYGWGNDPVSDNNDDPVAFKATWDDSTGITSVDASYNFTNEGKTFPTSSLGRRNISIQKNGNVVMNSYDNPNVYVFLLDENLAFISSQSISYQASTVGNIDTPPTIDSDNNIYISVPQNDKQVRIVKYSSDLSLEWTSSKIGISDPGTVGPTECKILAVSTGVVVYVQHPDGSNGSLTLISYTDGSIISTDTSNILGDGTDEVSMSNYSDSRFVIITANNVYVYEDDLTLFKKTSLSSIGFTGTSWTGAKYMQAWKDGTIIHSNPAQSFFSKYHPINLDIEFEVSHKATTIDFDIIERIVGSTINSGAGDNDGFYIRDNSTGSNIFSDIPVSGISEATSIQQLVLRYDNWQLDYFGGTDIDFSEIITATDTDYKIEIYEEAAAS